MVPDPVGVATGLQSKFDWAGVAGDAIGSGVTNSIQTDLAASHPGLGATPTGFISGTAGAIANAAVRTLINGKDFGDNLIAALPTVIGQTIGNAVAGALQGPSEVQSKIQATLNAPATDAETQAAAAQIEAGGADALLWGGKSITSEEAQQVIVDRMRMDALAQGPLGESDEFQQLYADFQSGLAAEDAYNTTSNQTLLGGNIQRVDSGSYLEGVTTYDAQSGYQGYLYHDNIGNKYIFANAGSQDALDAKTDIALVGDKAVSQLTVAQENALALVANDVPNLSFTGHSLGGALAIVQGLSTFLPVVTFNSAPFTKNMAGLYGVASSDVNLVRNYRVINDPLSMAENAHVMLSVFAGAAQMMPGGLIPPGSPATAMRLTPPPGQTITLGWGASGFTGAHSMVNVLNLMSHKY